VSRYKAVEEVVKIDTVRFIKIFIYEEWLKVGPTKAYFLVGFILQVKLGNGEDVV
jgi:hypothetical protein